MKYLGSPLILPYRFAGSYGGPDELEASRPITFVHDVSREAERVGHGTAQGWFGVALLNQHAAAGVLEATVAIHTHLAIRGYQREMHDVWYIGASVLQSALGIAEAALAVTGEGYPDANNSNRRQLLAVWDVSGFSALGGLTATSFLPPKFTLPRAHRLVDPGNGATTLRFASDATAAADASCDVLLWIGPRGATPPGAY